MLSNVAGQQFMSVCLREAGTIFGREGMFGAIKTVLVDWRFWIGGGLTVVCLLFWVLTLSQLPISKALPIMAMLFILSPLVAIFTVGDSVTNINIVGFVLVSVGIILSGIR